jgi:TnpA family transposase
VIEHWNSANGVTLYGSNSELKGADRESQEVSMLAMHLLQSSLVLLDTLLVQSVGGLRDREALGLPEMPRQRDGAASFADAVIRH